MDKGTDHESYKGLYHPTTRPQQERQKQPMGLVGKTATLHVHLTFLYIYFFLLHDYHLKLSNFTF